MGKNQLFQAVSMFWHALRAWNTGGEGIHSPRLFYLVRHVLYDSARLYAWEQIELRRQAMLRAPKLVHVVDYGTRCDRDELVMHIASRSLMPRKDAQMIAKLVYYMNGSEYVEGRCRGLHIVELGTSLGVTTAYLASLDSRNRVVSFEGSDEVADMAQLNWQKLHIDTIQLVRGNIDDTLFKYARECKSPIDVAVLDANHTGEATWRYFLCLVSQMDEDGMMVIDDIRYSPSMYAAWQQITKHAAVTATLDLGRMGLVFFYPKVQQRTYYLRV